MPKRTNQFQKLIAYIGEQVAPIGATVNESVELEEKGLDESVSREADILVELDTGLSTIRVAIECRDRSRKDSIQWIDDLIGKYANLPVDQVIAVSSSGFSSTALRKAKLHNIRTMSLEEASETDWPEQFAKLGIASVNQNFRLTHLQFKTTPEIDGKVNPEDRVVIPNSDLTDDSNEVVSGTVETFFLDIKESAVQAAQQYVKENFLSVYNTLADLDKDALVIREVPVSSMELHVEGEVYDVDKVVIVVRVRTARSEATAKRHMLSDKAMVTSVVVPCSEDAEMALSVVQVANRSEGKVFTEVRKTKHEG